MKWKLFVPVFVFGTLLLGAGCSYTQDIKSEEEITGSIKPVDNEVERVELTSEFHNELGKTNATPSVKRLLKEYPYLINPFKDIPLEEQGIIAVPEQSQIPFEFKEVKIEYNPYKPNNIDVVYKGGDKLITVSVWEWDKPLSDTGEEIQLNRGVTGMLYDNNKSLSIHWKYSSDKSALTYGVSLLTINLDMSLKKNEFSRENAINVANSIIDNYR
ncbi:hypothetical protein [Bacillus sp. 1P02SD]|uniref:hypothetical protein n=1 Tax=Bacillus sp. 1P02SD TaxID=3132264 RepID=UPI0039A161C4